MNKCDTKQNDLLKSLGPEYSIRYIDFERVIYRDFGNGFNVEISGMHTANEHKMATIYLWHGESFIVTSICKVARSDIADVVDKLYVISCDMLQSNHALPRGWGGAGCPLRAASMPPWGQQPQRPCWGSKNL